MAFEQLVFRDRCLGCPTRAVRHAGGAARKVLQSLGIQVIGSGSVTLPGVGIQALPFAVLGRSGAPGLVVSSPGAPMFVAVSSAIADAWRIPLAQYGWLTLLLATPETPEQQKLRAATAEVAYARRHLGLEVKDYLEQRPALGLCTPDTARLYKLAASVLAAPVQAPSAAPSPATDSRDSVKTARPSAIPVRRTARR